MVLLANKSVEQWIFVVSCMAPKSEEWVLAGCPQRILGVLGWAILHDCPHRRRGFSLGTNRCTRLKRLVLKVMSRALTQHQTSEEQDIYRDLSRSRNGHDYFVRQMAQYGICFYSSLEWWTNTAWDSGLQPRERLRFTTKSFSSKPKRTGQSKNLGLKQYANVLSRC